jgi:alginate O-acetyltransferase complex protein AlgI
MDVLLVVIGICIPSILLSWILPTKWQLVPIVITTAVFIGYLSPMSLAILTISCVLNFYTLKHIPSISTATLIVVIQMCSIFLFFKLEYNVYFNISESAILPIGLSYYSFRQIHYALEAYKKQLPAHTIIDYINYLFFLPTILIGPINRFQPFLKDYNKRRWNSSLFSMGLERILYGLVKITFIGNFIINNKLNSFIRSLSDDSIWLATYLKVFKYAANAYIQFAGYSEVAIGLSLLFGFKIIENFNFPFLATNIADFWRRWHISLSEWCKDYIFFPFLSITRNAKVSIIITMITLGLWHEISVRYILWGMLHAFAINVWYKYENTSVQERLKSIPLFKKCLGIFITIHFVVFSFVIISENSLLKSLQIFKILLMLNN